MNPAMNEEAFLKARFRDYYSRSFVDSVPAIEKREFGIGEFGKKITSRHLSFKTAKDFNFFLSREAPFYVSFSSAYYSFPAAKPMEAKELLRSDLAYEFDADDIVTDCKMLHDSWSCECGASGKGAPKNCTNCGRAVKVDEWVCPECLGEIKRQVFSLSRTLESELGISDGLFFNFSGSKGYHVHVRSEAFLDLSAQARIEVVDYLSGNTLDPALLGFFYSGKKFVAPKEKNAVGWSKRIISRLKSFFAEFSQEELSTHGGISFKAAGQVLSQKQKFFDSFNEGVLLQVPANKTEKFWNSLIAHAVELERIGIDRQTSIDMKKILRVPDSIHGSTGLLAKAIPFDGLKAFEPLKESVVFSGSPIKLKSVLAPRFYLGGQWFGPFDSTSEELPEFAAVYLLAKGHALLEK